MAKRKKSEVQQDPFLTQTEERIIERNAEDILGDCFGRYSKEIIQNRALPDARDGLKPVQRRILYGMYKSGNTYSKPYHKSAKTVGFVLGAYHPHSDSSVYDAMIRMSQDWLIRKPLVDVQGNNGSIDADSPAASRYCVTGDTIIMTTQGEIAIRDIVPNSKNDTDTDIDIDVYSWNGTVNHASKFFNSGVHDVYEVILESNRSIRGTSNHPLLVVKDGGYEWKTIGDLSRGDICLIPDMSTFLCEDGQSIHYYLVPIKSIESKGKEVVYSIRVDSECHSFIGNGFINHNTEARLSHIADYMLKDIDKETVKWVPNFSDEELEPTVLPTRYPHLLINGINGIASGYATNIPPHNLNELMNAVIYRVDHPDCTLDDLMKFVKGPDFPTGGIVMGIDGIKSALATGKGKVIVRGKAEVEKNQIIITEIPYEVVKCQLVKRMEDLRIDKKLAGVTEVRDESGRNGLRIVLDLKKDAPVESILNYLYKNTDLQVNINYNMTAIVDKAPKQIGLVKALDTFIRHREEVITRRSIFDKNKKMERQHILDGLIRALGMLDEVLKVIRSSANKADARANLVKTFDFTEKQAEAIVVMQLYKLTNTDVQELKDEHDQLAKDIAELTKILEDEEELKRVIIEESKEINDEFKAPRKSVIEGEIQDIVIDEQAMIPSETVQVAITREGYVKKVSNRSYLASGEAIARHKDGDIVAGQREANTRNTLIFFTNTGYFGKIPIYKLKEYKWKDLGDHLTSYVKVSATDKIVGGVIVEDFNSEATVVMLTQSNKIKKVSVKEFDISRQSKVTKAITLAKDDELKFVALAPKTDSMLYLTTREGKGNAFSLKGLSSVSTVHSGVKGMNVSKGDEIISMMVDPQEVVVLMSKFGDMKAIPTSAYASQSRTGSGRQLIKKGVDVDYALSGDEIVYIGALENHIQPKELTLTASRTTGYGKETAKEETEVEVLNRM